MSTIGYDDRNILVIINVNPCTHCSEFRTEILPILEKMTHIRIIKIDFDNMYDTILPVTYPIDLKRYLAWFPILIFCTAESWRKSAKSQDPPTSFLFKNQNLLVTSIFNGKITDDRPKPSEKDGDRNAENVVKWISRTLNEPPFQDAKIKRLMTLLPTLREVFAKNRLVHWQRYVKTKLYLRMEFVRRIRKGEWSEVRK